MDCNKCFRKSLSKNNSNDLKTYTNESNTYFNFRNIFVGTSCANNHWFNRIQTFEIMEKLTDILVFLSTIAWSRVDGQKLIGQFEGKEAILSFECNVSSTAKEIEEYPIQVVVYLKINGHHQTLWGCQSNAENVEFALWFRTTMTKTREAFWQENTKEKANLMKSVWDKIKAGHTPPQ